MSYLTTDNVRISGFAACVPKTMEDNLNLSLISGDEAKKFIESTGVRYRRIADNKTTTSDLCFHAVSKLITDLSWQKEDIDCIVFISQSADYILPATSCILQHRLGLSQETYCLDISSGCSGWVYGMSVITSLLQNGNFRKGILLAGETTLKLGSAFDKSYWPLFGDAGTATALEFIPGNKSINFHFCTDGGGFEAIIIPDGGFRNPFKPESLNYKEIEPGISRNNLHVHLNGMDVFSFAITKAPDTIKKLVSHFQLNIEEVDAFIFHQANLYMNEKIRNKLKLPANKVPYSLNKFGNTSSATIPLTLVTEWREKLMTSRQRLIACAFGVGLSWGSVYFETDKIICSNLVEI
ncbi:MAG: ketoacyl-ACP synthase III [Bacteroidetes bacterium]|nr:ketoacyl-ACP synthase III [Bacteroidota bacterium]